MKKIKTWQDAFKKKGLDPNVLPDVSMIPEEYKKAVIAQYIMSVVADVLNEGWIADYTDSDQCKYQPYFVVNASKEKPSGFGLSCLGYDRWSAGTDCGVRLCYKDAETAKYAGTQFIKLYEDLYLLGK
jgi:hypothetical protein